MDIAMETLDGLAATRALVAMDAAARVVILTNFDGADLRAAARAAGASGYVLKDNLLDLVPTLLGLPG
jgi:DNA-binding NarL/FixJ family response regulator